MRKTLAAKTEEVQALNDKHLRLAAEFENYKRLSQRDQREFSKFANENLLKELLPIVDNLERAIKSVKDGQGGQAAQGIVQGVELTLKQCRETLAKFGVQVVPTVGQAFDPACHQAVARVESASAGDNTVLEEHQKGYRLHDRLLRPAMVTVAMAPADSAQASGASA